MSSSSFCSGQRQCRGARLPKNVAELSKSFQTSKMQKLRGLRVAKSDTGNWKGKALDRGGYWGLRGAASALLSCIPRKYLFLRHELMRCGRDGAPALAVKSAFNEIEAGHNGMVMPARLLVRGHGHRQQGLGYCLTAVP